MRSWESEQGSGNEQLIASGFLKVIFPSDLLSLS